METFKSLCSKLLDQMEGDLLDIRLEHPHVSDWSKKSIPYLQHCLAKLKALITEHPFKKRSEEIWFFKEVKPVVMGRLIFMCQAHNKEIFRPSLNIAKEKDYLMSEVDVVNAFFDSQQDLYEYYKDGLDTLDIKFFVREVDDRFNYRELPVEIDPVLFYGDPGFSTGFDYLFAQFRGYELLRVHLEGEFEALHIVGDEIPPEQIKFTGSSADFVEMVNLFKNVAKPTDPETGRPVSDEELYQFLKKGFNPDVPDDLDFETLKLLSGNSDFPEKMLEALYNLHKKWDEEDEDINYDNPDGDNPKE